MFKSAIFLRPFLLFLFCFSTFSKDLGLETSQIAPTDYFYRTVITRGMSRKLLQAFHVLRRLARGSVELVKLKIEGRTST